MERSRPRGGDSARQPWTSTALRRRSVSLATLDGGGVDSPRFRLRLASRAGQCGALLPSTKAVAAGEARRTPRRSAPRRARRVRGRLSICGQTHRFFLGIGPAARGGRCNSASTNRTTPSAIQQCRQVLAFSISSADLSNLMKHCRNGILDQKSQFVASDKFEASDLDQEVMRRLALDYDGNLSLLRLYSLKCYRWQLVDLLDGINSTLRHPRKVWGKQALHIKKWSLNHVLCLEDEGFEMIEGAIGAKGAGPR
ncbi:hypothetical protein C2845_PM01G04540 [Panicum miliaceum]|uniref:Uncharacterized protein n=1 Tax=Panicum miliaceum TaxID=4540 RepID=A0A3L6TPX6_PANMI|nr:hypothetical protein C2845_PM01G04540 [Panicum miliaceum]